MTFVTTVLSEEQKQVLEKARKVYGNTNQILVSNEELCELAAVCAKFPRYGDPCKAQRELHQKAVDEVADVLIVLDHVINIFGLEDEEIHARVSGKVNRLQRWLAASSSMEQTTVDRDVSTTRNAAGYCVGCAHVGNFQNLKPGQRCHACINTGWSLYESREAHPSSTEQPEKVEWSKAEPCPITPNQFESVWEDADDS